MPVNGQDALPHVHNLPKFKLLSSIAGGIANLLGNHIVAITNTILVAITFGAEELLEKEYFSCPCEHSYAKTYGWIYLLLVAAIFWLIGIIVHNSTSKLFQGCCQRKNYCGAYYWGFFFSILVETTVVPAAWIFVLLLDGDYVACIESEAPCEKESDEYKAWKSYSHTCGLIFLASYLFVALCGRGFYQCCNKNGYLLHKYIAVYRDVEEQEYSREMVNKANELAVEVVGGFLNQKPKKEDWEKVSDLDVPESNKDGTIYLSPTHNYAYDKQLLPND